MSIAVGINDNVTLKGAEINEKGSLEISFSQGADLSDIPTDDLLNDAAGVKPAGAAKIMLFPIDVEANGEKRDADRISKDIVSVRDQLEHILQGYMPKKDAMLNPYDGLDLTKENFKTEILKASVVERMFKNLTGQFIAKVKALTAEQLEQKFRLLLVRRSAAKNFGTFRKMFITDNPFWEPMSIVEAGASKVKFTRYEIDKGMNDGSAVKKEEVADQTADDQSTADDILGSR